MRWLVDDEEEMRAWFGPFSPRRTNNVTVIIDVMIPERGMLDVGTCYRWNCRAQS